MVAAELDLAFSYTVPSRMRGAQVLFPVRYDFPPSLGPLVKAKRVAVLNDVINAGSAVRGTLEAVRNAGGDPVLVASLAVLGDAAQGLADEHRVPLETLERVPNAIWRPEECPLCRAGKPLTRAEGA
jgi:orotate phosphoribosyltransferase